MNQDFYIGVKGCVVRIERSTGKIIWKTQLKGGHLTTLVVDDDLIVAHTKGELFGVSRDDGSILWKNPLTGLGYGPCIIATKAHDTEVAQIVQARQAAASNGGAAS